MLLRFLLFGSGSNWALFGGGGFVIFPRRLFLTARMPIPHLFFFLAYHLSGEEGTLNCNLPPPFYEIYFPAASPREGRWGEHLTLFIKKVYGKKGGVGLLIGRFNGALKIRDRELP